MPGATVRLIDLPFPRAFGRHLAPHRPAAGKRAWPQMPQGNGTGMKLHSSHPSQGTRLRQFVAKPHALMVTTQTLTLQGV